MKLKKGDTVKILIGKDKNKEGKVEKIYLRDNLVLILGVNEFKRHVKSRAGNPASRQGGQKSEIITITKPLPASNVALICPKCKKATRVSFKIEKDKKIRICAKCRKEID